MAAAINFSLLIDLAFILLSAAFFSYIFRLLKQPMLLAYLVAGLVVGPLALGQLGIVFHGIPLGITNLADVAILSELGVAFLLFGVGVETDFSKLRDIGKTVAVGAGLQVLITAGSVLLLNVLFNLLSFSQAIYLGLILSFSSTMVVVKLLSDARQINSLHARLMIGFLLIQDVIVILALPLLANLDAISSAGTSLLFSLVVQALLLIFVAFLLNRFFYKPLFDFASQNDELLFLAALSSAFFFILLSYSMNFSIAVGAFIAGVSLSTLPYSLEVFDRIRALRDFFVTIFFVTLGMQISLAFSAINFWLIVLIVAIVFLLKPLLFYLLTLFSGYGSRLSMVVAFSLVPISEFSFILASQGKDVLEQTPGLYSFIIFIIAVSMVLAPYLFEHSSFLYAYLDRIVSKRMRSLKSNVFVHRKIRGLEKVSGELQKHIVLIGGGVMGFSVAEVLKDDYPLVLIDHNSEVVFKAIRKGINAAYGSFENRELWDRLNLKGASLLLMMVPDVKGQLRLLKLARKFNPEIVVCGRAHYFHEALALYKAGANFVVMPHVIGGNIFIEKLSKYLDSGEFDELLKLDNEYMKYLEEKANEEKGVVK
ncbi:MAG: cation:proton antiporter [Candidatus Diapherotrites archaeon]